MTDLYYSNQMKLKVQKIIRSYNGLPLTQIAQNYQFFIMSVSI